MLRAGRLHELAANLVFQAHDAVDAPDPRKATRGFQTELYQSCTLAIAPHAAVPNAELLFAVLNRDVFDAVTDVRPTRRRIVRAYR